MQCCYILIQLRIRGSNFNWSRRLPKTAIVMSGSTLGGFLDFHNVSVLYYAGKKTAFLQQLEEAHLELFFNNSCTDLKIIMRGLRETTNFMIV